MIKIIKNADIYAPEHLGKKDILIAGERIAFIDDQIDPPASFPSLEVIEGEGMIATPGFIDSHVHITGGGGEGGFVTRTPEMKLTDATTSGVTTVIGILGTDGTTRSLENLIAKAQSLNQEGISCKVLIGSYQVPVRTLTGRIDSDIMMINEVIGVGEIAISDHRSFHPSYDEILRIVAEARVGGMLSGKAGVVNLHLGDGEGGLSLIKEVIRNTEIPYSQFVPTHINRNPELFDEGVVFARDGGQIDFTTSTTQVFLDEGEVKCSKALRRCLDRDVPVERITFTSDGQGSLPIFDEKNEFCGLRVGTSSSLFKEVRDAVQQENVLLETAIRVITSNPATIYKLSGKGVIRQGADADIALINADDLAIRTVIARGKIMVKDGEAVVKGAFE